MKNNIYFVLLFLTCTVLLFANGKIDEVSPNDPTSWEESIDISSKKSGKYNVLITGTDTAGNEGYFGPFNMFVDPDSDLPVVMISNPASEAKVGGNLNIVGTCADDDSVAYVEFRIDNEETIYRAKGKDFWSYYIDTTNFLEGPHTIEAWGVDSNGVKGNSYKTVFHLDRREPTTEIKNRSVGEFVSGTISVNGIVKDGNGIERLLYSIDGGITFENVKIKTKKGQTDASFSVKIDTKKMDDGPQVCWLKAVDKQHTIGIYTFLFFVDNTLPIVEFISPNDSDVLSSIFSVAGRAFDTVGLSRLSYKCGDVIGDFELTPGNPYWIKEFDCIEKSGKGATVEIRAEDLAGNVVISKKRIGINNGKDTPKLHLVMPESNQTIDDHIFISGCAYDIHGVNKIFYKLDNGPETLVETEVGRVGVMINDIVYGNHKLQIYPVNVKGIKGNVVTIPFKANGASPIIHLASGNSVANISSITGGVANIVTESEIGLKSVFYNIDDQGDIDTGIKVGSKKNIIKIAVKKEEDAKIKSINVTAIDVLDRKVSQTILLQISNSMSTVENEFKWAKNNMTDSGKCILLSDSVLEGLYQASDGSIIESVTLNSCKGNLSVNYENNKIVITPIKGGICNNVSLTIKDSNGKIHNTSSIDLLVDMDKPIVNLQMPNEFFVKNSFLMQGYASDDTFVKNITYQVAGLDPVSISSKINKTVNIAQLEDGPLTLIVTVEDAVGKKSSIYKTLYKDTSGPIVKNIIPPKDDSVNGRILVGFTVEDEFPLKKVEYKVNTTDKVWKSVDITSMPNILIGESGLPISNRMIFKFTDQSGSETIVNSYDFTIDASSDEPVVEIHLPQEDDVLIDNFNLSGIVYDDDAASKVYYKIDNSEYKSLLIENTFSIPLTISSFTDNEHVITMYAEDIYGVKSKPISRKIRVSRDVPYAEIINPKIDRTVNGSGTISGVSSDKNGIEKIEISLDNGNTYNLASGKEKWEYKLNTHIIDDGTHVLFVKAYDKYGQTATYSSLINIDNTPPNLQFTYPLLDSILDSHLFISGHAHDNISLEAVTARIKSLDGKGIPSRLREMTIGKELLVSKDVNISSLSEGRYNLEIVAVDKGNNETTISRNFQISRDKYKNRVEFLYPLNGEYVSGEFNIYGRIVSDQHVEAATLYVNGKETETVNVSKTNYVSFKLTPEQISEGIYNLSIRAKLPQGRGMESNIHSITYEPSGPWVSIDNFGMGDFAIDRPYLYGHAGYTISVEDTEKLQTKQMSKEDKRLYKLKKLENVEVSFDNGKTFRPAKLSKKGWKYRIETGNLSEGHHFLLVRAVMKNKEVAISRTIVNIDKTSPVVTLISPGEGGKYNQSLQFSGLASDDIELNSINIALRKGDKATYGVPQFIQGLHFETGFWGASLWNIGFGLGFFDNNVKVQLHYGQFTRNQYKVFMDGNMRYGGNIFSLKLLANIFDVPVGFFAGPDWDWLHFTGALGANFSLFTDTQSGKPQVLSGILTQLELPRVQLSKKHKKYFRSFAFFLEGTLWFVPTDVNSVSSSGTSSIRSVVPHLSCGFRLDVF